MKVLVINSGSSSVKYQLIDMETEHVLAKGLCERIGIDGVFTHKWGDQKRKIEVEMPTHSEAIKHVLEALISPETGVINSLSEIDAIGHRIVQGGAIFTESTLVDDDVVKKISDLASIAPLHNPAHVLGLVDFMTENCRRRGRP